MIPYPLLAHNIIIFDDATSKGRVKGAIFHLNPFFVIYSFLGTTELAQLQARKSLISVTLSTTKPGLTIVRSTTVGVSGRRAP